jgi:hypothetical protein
VEPRISLSQDLVERLAAVGIDDAHIQFNLQQAFQDDPSMTGDLFTERLIADLETLERNKAEYEAEQAKQRQIDEAHQRQANRIALAGMALPACITGASRSTSIKDIAETALAFADALLAKAEASKDPNLNA